MMTKSNDPVLQFIEENKDSYYTIYSRQWVLTEEKYGKIVANHIIYLGMEYRDTVSYSCFVSRELERGFGKKSKASGNWLKYAQSLPRLFCHSEHRAQVELFKDAHAMIGVTPTNNIPCYEHDSVWKFYEAIGYDYKKQRFN